MRLRQATLLAILPLLAAFVTGCPFAPGKQKPKPPVSKYLEQTNAPNCLANLRQAYIDRDIDEYLKLFSNDFTFVFNPADVESPVNPTPSQWGLPEERTSTDNMFRDEKLNTIELSFIPGEPAGSNEEFPESWKVEMTDINLTLDTRAEDGSPLKQMVTSGHCTFYFHTYPEEPINGKPKWKIFRWVDQGFGSSGGGALVASTHPAR